MNEPAPTGHDYGKRGRDRPAQAIGYQAGGYSFTEVGCPWPVYID